MLLNNDFILITGCVLAGLLVFALVALFFISRKSQKVMRDLLDIMLDPERAKVSQASRLVGAVMSREMDAMQGYFQKVTSSMEQNMSFAKGLESEMDTHNKTMVAAAADAAQQLSNSADLLRAQLESFKSVLSSKQWKSMADSAQEFNSSINGLLTDVDTSVQNISGHAIDLQSKIDGWIESGKNLSEQLQSDMENNTSYMNSLVVESDAMREKIENLTKSVSGGFDEIKDKAKDYESVMSGNEKLLSKQLEKMEAFTKQSKSLLVSQMNTLTNTANAVGGQIRLVESSMEKQERILAETVGKLMESAQSTGIFVGNISTEVSALTVKFRGEVREFATDVVGELNNVCGVANATLDDTKNAASAFSESVKMMADGVRDTLIEMNEAHTKLTQQSENLIKMSGDTTAQLQPLSELIEKYYSALPELTKDSSDMTSQLSAEVASLDEKIRVINETVKDSIVAIADSSMKLENLSGQSRQQMIDLLSDYAKAVDTMQTLNRQMTEARVSAPMQAMSKVPASNIPAGVTITSAEFIAQSERLMERLHELSVDLTRAVGAEIPNSIWDRYHSGDKTIFSKWFAKMLGAADKKRVRELFKSDAVFRSQATQFVRGFSKMLAGAEHTDNKEMVTGTLLKTDLGQMYLILKTYV